MASRLVQAAIATPGFLGLNTEQHAAQSQERFATELKNAVFDQAGKITCRNGFDPTVTASDSVKALFWWRKDKDTRHLLAVVDGEGTDLYRVTQTTNPFDTLTIIGTLNGVSWAFANVNGHVAIAQQGYTPQYWNGTTFSNFAAATGATNNPTGGVILSAFGKLWMTSNDGTTVYGSDLQPSPSAGINWDNNVIDLTGLSGAGSKGGWTFGNDFVTALASIGNLLVIFGKESIVVYEDLGGTITLADSITGVGCVSQFSVVNVGDDILFLSNTGVRSLRRTLEKESPQMNDISQFVRSDLLAAVTFADVISVHSQIDGFYLLSDGDICYMWDLRQQLPNNARRTSDWTLTPNAMTYDPDSNQLFMAVNTKIGIYREYDDDDASYKLTLKSAWLDLSTSAIKLVKKLGAIIYNGNGYTPEFFLAFDYREEAEEMFFAEALPNPTGSEWSVSEWGLGEWSGPAEQINRRYIQAAGSGLYVRYGVQFIVDGFEVGIQEVRMTAKMGKLSHV